MNVGIILFVLILVSNNTFGDINITDEEYESLPKIFRIDPYQECLEKKQNYCKVVIQLQPLDPRNPSKIWKLIQRTTKSSDYYNHEQLRHAICLKNHNEPIKRQIIKYYRKKYKSLGLDANITKVDCNNYDNIHQIKPYDSILLAIMVLYALFLCIVTIYDLKVSPKSATLVAFSFRNNLSILKKNYQNNTIHELKCIQGFRFYIMLLIILCHTFCSYSAAYIENTRYLENFSQNVFRHGFRNLFGYLVQTFFLVSAWLLSYHSFQSFQNRNVNFSKYVLVTFANRYLRILPPLLVMICLSKSIWIVRWFYGPIKDIYSDQEYYRCQRTWWVTLLFINNHYNKEDMCYFITWYLSADTQLYAISLLILFVIWNINKFIKLSLGIAVILGIAIQTVVTYWYNLDLFYRITPRNSKNTMFQTFTLSATYSSTYSNSATYMLGLLFGYIYFKHKNDGLFAQQSSRYLWLCAFVGLPMSVLTISAHYYTGITAAFLSGVLRPIFALGVGIGIFGIAQGIKGWAKRFFEWRPAVFLGQITYSTYVVHFGIVFARTALATEPIYLSDYILLKSFIRDAIFSFLCGFVMHLTIEMPASQLQNIFMPKIRANTKKVE